MSDVVAPSTLGSSTTRSARAWRFMFVGAVALGVVLPAAGIGYQWIYKGFVVPRLSTVSSVPISWWLLTAAPILIVLLALGAWSKRMADVVAATLGASVGYSLFTFWAKFHFEPGFQNHGAVRLDTSTILEFASSCASFFLPILVVVAAGRLLGERGGRPTGRGN